ncbi:MAG: MOSC domain-containing protein [Candidatus Velthaea sp.]
MHIGSVAALWRYPVKSLAREELVRAEVRAEGFAGDRTSALIVATPDHPRAGKTFRGKEHNGLHVLRDASAAVEAARGAGVTLEVAAGERYFDARPVSLIFDRWLRDVEALVGHPLDPLRFRPNIFAHAAQGFNRPESAMVGMTLGAGTVVLGVVDTIRRCVTPTYDVATGEPEPALLRAIAQQRDNTIGIYCTIIRPGTVARGDALVAL